MFAQAIVDQLSPEHITAFKGLSAEALLGLCFFALLTIVIPVAVFLIARAYTRSMEAMTKAFIHAINKRDEDQKNITKTLEKMILRLTTLESKVDRIGGRDPTPP